MDSHSKISFLRTHFQTDFSFIFQTGYFQAFQQLCDLIVHANELGKIYVTQATAHSAKMHN
jgi:hypothetical protein